MPPEASAEERQCHLWQLLLSSEAKLRPFTQEVQTLRTQQASEMKEVRRFFGVFNTPVAVIRISQNGFRVTDELLTFFSSTVRWRAMLHIFVSCWKSVSVSRLSMRERTKTCNMNFTSSNTNKVNSVKLLIVEVSLCQHSYSGVILSDRGSNLFIYSLTETQSRELAEMLAQENLGDVGLSSPSEQVAYLLVERTTLLERLEVVERKLESQSLVGSSNEVEHQVKH